MASDDQEKSEDPTDKRRADARQKGNVAKSTDMNAAAMMLAASSGLLFLGPKIGQTMIKLVQGYLSGPALLQLDSNGVVQDFRDIATLIAGGLLPFVLLMFTAALAINLAQIGFLFTTEPLQLKWERLNPLSGAKRIASITSVVKLSVSIGKIIIFASIVVWFIYSHLPAFAGLLDTDPITIFGYASWLTVQLAFQLSLALFAIAILDFSFQKWKHEQDLKMSKQEIRDEMKNMDGDPMIKHQRREAHRKIAEARELNAVQDADVVINNPTHISVALRYNPEKDPAPIVVAKGAEEIAFRIREIARENNIPMIERKPLARMLYKDVKVGQSIPPDLYETFIEIMAYVYRLTDKKLPDVAA